MEKISFIIPPSGFLLDERMFVSLGVLHVAAAVRARGHKVEVLDLSGVKNYLDAVRAHVAFTETDIFGITATTPQLPPAVAIAEAIRAGKPKAKTILGGPHVTLVNAALRSGKTDRGRKGFEQLLSIFDVLVAGDGEKAIFQALNPNAPKLVDADIPKDENFLTIGELNRAPYPARDLIDLDSYRFQVEGERGTSILAQLGCPFGCKFCGGRNSPTFRRMRTRSVDAVVAEMVYLDKKYGYKAFMFYDDELNVRPDTVELLKAITQAQLNERTKWKMRGFVKAELLTLDQAEAMREAGFRWIHTGVESGSPRILENIQKIATAVDNARCVEIAHRAGLKVKTYTSVGHPGESEQTIQETEDWLIANKPDDFDTTTISVYPGTPYFDEAIRAEDSSTWIYRAKNGDLQFQREIDYSKVADYFKGDPNDGYHSYVWTEHLTAVELVTLRDRVERNVRAALGISYNQSRSAIPYDQSMGQLPNWILRQLL